MRRTLISCLIASLLGCEKPIPRDPSTLVPNLVAEFEAAGPLSLWKALPPGYRGALQARLARLHARLREIDKGTWAAGVSCLREAAMLIKVHGPELQRRYGQLVLIASADPELGLRRGADAALRISQSSWQSLESLRLAQPEVWLDEFGEQVWPLLLQALRAFRQLLPSDLADLRCTRGKAPGMYELHTPWGTWSGLWTQVEGRWLPTALQEAWPAQLQRLDALLARAEERDFALRWRQAKASIVLVEKQLRALRESEEPLEALQDLIERLDSMRRLLGLGGGNQKGR